jgi:cytochrome c-type biogenesis protein CcmE
LFKANIISQPEAREVLAKSDENYGDLQPLETNKFYSEIGKTNSIG